jgi:hypothetical protein
VYAVAGDRDLRARRSAPSGGQAPERGPSPLASSGREVSGEIAPGLYASGSETGGCSYELWRVMRDRSEQVIGEDHLDQGRLLVTINDIEPDWFTSSAGCGRWLDWAALATPLTEAGNGDYWVGDLATGLWSIPDGCRWEKVVGFRGALLHDVVDSIVGPDVVAVDGETLGVRARSCHQPAVLSIPAARAAP